MKGKYYILLLLLSISIKVKAQIEIPKFVYVLNSKCLTTYIGERKWVSNFSVYNEKGQDLGHYEYIGRYSCKRIVVAKKRTIIPGQGPTQTYLGSTPQGDMVYSHRIGDHGTPEHNFLDDYDVLDENWKSILKFPIKEAVGFSEDVCGVKVGNKYGFIDLNGNWIKMPVYEYVGVFRDGYCVIGNNSATKLGIIDHNFKEVIPISSEIIDVKYNLLENNGNVGVTLYIKNGKEIKGYQLDKLLEVYKGDLRKAIQEYK